MRPTKKFTPSICSEGKYEGYVILNVPTYDERNDFFFIADYDMEKSIEGVEMSEAEKDALTLKKTKARIKNIKDQLPAWIVEINIKRIDDGFIFDSYESVKYDSEVGALGQEMINELIGKFRYGNPLLQPS